MQGQQDEVIEVPEEVTEACCISIQDQGTGYIIGLCCVRDADDGRKSYKMRFRYRPDLTPESGGVIKVC